VEILNEILLQARVAVRDLLAIIHRDGGHHTEEVGFIQSCKDAERIVQRMHCEDCDEAEQMRTKEIKELRAQLAAICQKFSDHEDEATPEQLPARFDTLNNRRIKLEARLTAAEGK
jgi:hypothetical protein